MQLLLASFIVLFQELALIRWLPAQVRVIAYFPNLVLIGAFLGLGIGCLQSRRRSLLFLWPIGMFTLTVVAGLLSLVAFTQESETEHLWLLYYDLGRDAPQVHSVRLPIVLLFVLSAFSFVPLGQLVAQKLSVFQRSGAPLRGYFWDLSGSLIGTVAFAVASFWRAPAVVWFAVLMTAGTLLFSKRRGLAAYVILGLMTVGVVIRAETADVYSPYYALTFGIAPNRLTVGANGSLHQVGLPLRRNDNAPEAAEVRSGYHLTYDRLGRRPRRVLVLGAGTGNDVAVALDEGAERVDAVEVDPVILEMGKKYHPDHPYDSDRVRRIQTDARRFLNESRDSYDLIVFGTLDSMTRLSALSSVRLDNYVYTIDCLEAAKERLTPDGGLALYFMVGNPAIDEKLFSMLTVAFGEYPAVIPRYYGLFNRLYLAGPAFAKLPRPDLPPREEYQRRIASAVDIPSDDWPFLYLGKRSVSPFYLSLMGILMAIAMISTVAASPELRRGVSRGALDVEMFLYGLAFLLIETKFVTEMNLVWGATWITSAVVFGSILLVLLIATVTIQLRPIPWWLSMTGLVISLLANYMLPTRLLLSEDAGKRLMFSVLFVGFPLFFAASCFALRYRDRQRVDVAFGWNLLGAVGGGLLEFVSMAVGLKALTLVGLVAYLLAILAMHRRADTPMETASGRVTPRWG